MKYIDTDKLKSEIQSLIDLGYDKLQGNLYHVISLIDSLQQEQPDVDIREEIKKLEFMGSNDARDILHVAEHFYELGKNSK